MMSLEKWVNVFERIIKNGQLHHAYLISGPVGTGRQVMAKWLLRRMLCIDGNESCDNCQAWQTSDEGNLWHPDLVSLRASSGHIVSVEDVRQAMLAAGTTPSLGQKRVLYIENIELLNAFGLNAMLKTLEEPPAYLYVVAVINNIDNLPATILSRFHKINLSPLPIHELQTMIDDKIAVSLSAGRAQLAEELATNKIERMRYEQHAIQFGRLCLAPAAEQYKEIESLSNDKKLTLGDLQQLLQHWQLIMRDVLLVKAGLVNRVAHSFMMVELEKMASRGTLLKWLELFDELILLDKSLQTNGQRKLQIGKFFSQIPL